jgi:hypothetical protein
MLFSFETAQIDGSGRRPRFHHTVERDHRRHRCGRRVLGAGLLAEIITDAAGGARAIARPGQMTIARVIGDCPETSSLTISRNDAGEIPCRSSMMDS